MSVNPREIAEMVEMGIELNMVGHGELADALNKLRIIEPEALEAVFNPVCSSTPEKASYAMEMKVQKKRYRPHRNTLWATAKKSLKF